MQDSYPVKEESYLVIIDGRVMSELSPDEFSNLVKGVWLQWRPLLLLLLDVAVIVGQRLLLIVLLEGLFLSILAALTFSVTGDSFAWSTLERLLLSPWVPLFLALSLLIFYGVSMLIVPWKCLPNRWRDGCKSALLARLGLDSIAGDARIVLVHQKDGCAVSLMRCW